MQRHLHLVLEIAIRVGEQAHEVGHVGRQLGGGDLRKGRGSRTGQSLRDDHRQVVVAVGQGDRQAALCASVQVGRLQT